MVVDLVVKNFRRVVEEVLGFGGMIVCVYTGDV